MPLVSVVIPCYQQGHFLPRAVRSVLDQTLSDIEAIVVDDGSRDDPLSQLGDLARDPRVVYMRQENSGVAAARNVGIYASHGTFLNFLDADDWLAPEFCQRLLPRLVGADGLGFVYCDLHHVYEGTARPKAGEEYSVGSSRRVVSGDILPSLLLGGYFPPQAVLVRKTVVEQIGVFDPELGGHADWDLWLRIAASGYPVQYLDEKLVYYRKHDHNMSSVVEHMRSTRLLALRKLFRLFPDVVAGAIHELCASADEQFVANRFLQEQVAAADSRAGMRTDELSQTRAEVSRLRDAVAYWQKEAERLKDVEQKFTAYFQETQAWIAKQDEVRKWHEQQAENWRLEAERLAGNTKKAAS